MSWSVVAEVIGIVGQPTIVRLMPGLRPSRTGVLAFLFLVGGRRLRRSPRRFVRSLKLDHQLNQLVLAQALQISPIHAHMDSEIALRGKGVGKYRCFPLSSWRVSSASKELSPRSRHAPSSPIRRCGSRANTCQLLNKMLVGDWRLLIQAAIGRLH